MATSSQSSDKMHFAVLGAGSWGTALAVSIAKQGHECVLWGHRPEVLDSLAKAQENARYLPGVKLPPNLQFHASLEEVVERCDVLLCMTPTHSLPTMFSQLSASIRPDQQLWWGSKGFEREQGLLIHELAQQQGLALDQCGVLTGPSFAGEVARLQPTALVAASQNQTMAVSLAEQLNSDVLRCYSSEDVIGAEIGGAVKNVIAVAAGMADGLGFGANTRAALITRGLAEITRLAVALGAHASSMMGLAGMGDLLLTATDNQSRNRRFGLGLGEGLSVSEAEQRVGQVVEGRYAAAGALRRAQQLGVDMPITEALVAILNQQLTPQDAMQRLMQRPAKPEMA